MHKGRGLFCFELDSSAFGFAFLLLLGAHDLPGDELLHDLVGAAVDGLWGGGGVRWDILIGLQ